MCTLSYITQAEEYLRSRGIAWNRDEGCFEREQQTEWIDVRTRCLLTVLDHLFVSCTVLLSVSPSKFFESVSNTHSANSTAPRELVNSIGAWVDAQPDVFIKLLLPAKDNDAAGRRFVPKICTARSVFATSN